MFGETNMFHVLNCSHPFGFVDVSSLLVGIYKDSPMENQTLSYGSKKASTIFPFTCTNLKSIWYKIRWCNETVGEERSGVCSQRYLLPARCPSVCNHQPGWLSPISSSSWQVVSWFLNVPEWSSTKQVEASQWIKCLILFRGVTELVHVSHAPSGGESPRLSRTKTNTWRLAYGYPSWIQHYAFTISTDSCQCLVLRYCCSLR